MTWIRCSDRMPMGEDAEVRYLYRDSGAFEPLRHPVKGANVERLRYVLGDDADWIDRTEWRAVEPSEYFGELLAGDARPDGKMNVTFSTRLPVEPSGDPGPLPEHPRFPCVMPDFDATATESETLRAIVARDGLPERWMKLMEECGELIGAVAKWRGPDWERASTEAIAEEAADVSIVLDSIMTDPGWGESIREARARKLARLRERLG